MGATLSSGAGSSRRRRRRSAALMQEINVTPFVDVMLVLLIIFMVTAPLLASGVKVDLPQAQAAPLAATKEPLTITVKQDGTLFLQKESLKLATLQSKLRAIMKQSPQTQVMLRGDRHTPYQYIARALAALQEAGVQQVALQTKELEGR